MDIETHRMISAISILNECEDIDGEILWLKKNVVDAILDLAQYAYSKVKGKVEVEAAIHASASLIYERGVSVLQYAKEAIDQIAAESN